MWQMCFHVVTPLKVAACRSVTHREAWPVWRLQVRPVETCSGTWQPEKISLNALDDEVLRARQPPESHHGSNRFHNPAAGLRILGLLPGDAVIAMLSSRITNPSASVALSGMQPPRGQPPTSHARRNLSCIIYLFILLFYPVSVYLRGVVYPYSSISAFNDPASLCAVPLSRVLWLYLYFGRVCLHS